MSSKNCKVMSSLSLKHMCHFQKIRIQMLDEQLLSLREQTQRIKVMLNGVPHGEFSIEEFKKHVEASMRMKLEKKLITYDETINLADLSSFTFSELKELLDIEEKAAEDRQAALLAKHDYGIQEIYSKFPWLRQKSQSKN